MRLRKLTITCLVDNAVEFGTPFWGEHGLALLIESQDGRLLFDTGASGSILLHNMQSRRIDPRSLSALAISHAHRDHTGGLRAILGLRPGLPLHANGDLLRERFSRRKGAIHSVGLPLTPQDLGPRADLRLSVDRQEILPGTWTTGEIALRPHPEGRSPHHVVRQGGAWAPDPYRDDMALVLETPRGLVLVCGCCHAGLLNTLDHVRRTFGADPVAVVGGTHLVSADADHLGRLLKELDRLGPPALHVNHCTGLAAYLALALAFGEQAHPCPVGTVL
jgi:7,8-dihydropterin-6-yl-methyl-4-(beta-D-ribofuranosyl)aminobenzene 5'-phosphate synthase